ncbi:MAG: PAS domain S-box protein [Synechococcaceae cyanobacterium SM2_3_1]|nr:PAS domain S-box protein [Synechococcaceae cyanobacterium SM2_3_1]
MGQSDQVHHTSSPWIEFLFQQTLDGVFLMLLPEPVAWVGNGDSEETLELVFQNQRVVQVNSTLLTQYQCSQQDILGLSMSDFFSHDPVKGREILRQLLETRHARFETEERRADGTPIWIQGDYLCLYDQQGRYGGHLGIQRDITDRKQEEIAQTQRDLYLQAIVSIQELLLTVKSSVQSVYPEILSALAQVTRASRVYIFETDRKEEDQLLCSQKAEWCAQTCTPQIDNPDLQNIQLEQFTLLFNSLIQGHPFSAIIDKLPDPEREVLLEQSIKAILITPIKVDDHLYGFIGFDNCDLEELWDPPEINLLQSAATAIALSLRNQQSNLELKKSESKLKSIFDQAAVGINQADLSGRFITVNQRFCDLLGYSRDQLLTLRHQDITHPEDRNATTEEINSLLRDELSSSSLEKRYLHKDGHYVWTHITLSIVRNEAGEVISDLAIVEDISKRKQIEADLYQSNQLLDQIINNSNALIYAVDLFDRHILANRPYQKLVNRSLDALLEAAIEDILPSDVADTYTANHYYVLNCQQALEIEENLVYPNGEEHTYLSTKFPLYDHGGQLYGIGSLSTDITDLKLAESQLSRQIRREQSLNRLVQAVYQTASLEEVFASAVEEGGRLFAADWVYIVQYLPEYGLWKPLKEFRNTADLPTKLTMDIPDQDNFIAQRLKRGEWILVDESSVADAVNHELMQQFPSSWLLIPLEVNGTTWGSFNLIRSVPHAIWEQSEVDLARSIATQISFAIQKSYFYLQLQDLNQDLERQIAARTAQLTEALEFEATLRRITELVRDSLDENTILKSVVQELSCTLQSQCCDTTLYNLENQSSQVLFESIHQTLTPAEGVIFNMQDHAEIYPKLLKGYSLRFCHLSPAGNRPIGSILACPVHDSEGVIGDIWIYQPPDYCFSDAQVRLVEQVANQCSIAIRQSRLYQAAQIQIDTLERLNYLKDDFISTVSHELRTPLTTVRMALRMMHEAPSEAKRQQYYQMAVGECERQIEMINDLLDLQRLSANRYQIRAENLTWPDWIDEFMFTFQTLAEAHELKLTVMGPETSFQITTDRVSLERILRELLNNACKYTPAGGEIQVQIESGVEGMQLQVRNTGRMDAAQIPLIFERFYRIPQPDRWRHSGTGLGLALVKQLLQILGGSIQVQSENGWIQFTVWLPWTLAGS